MDAGDRLSAVERMSWRAVLEMCTSIVDGADADVDAFGLSGADYEMLLNLSEAEHGLRMSELAARALMSKSRLTYRVDRLEARGLVVREHCSTDRRGYLARLTAEGSALLAEATPHHVAGVRDRLVDRLGDEQFVTLGRMAATVLGRDFDVALAETH
ncbi:MAG: MarR family transcriptional regulator [Acidimicrobiales bacterium]